MPFESKNISVIIPALNEERTIGRVVQAVLSQPCVTEVIVVDNGSTDETYCIAQGVALTDKRVKVYEEKRRGKALAIKKGLENAEGELIIFQDADLEYSPSAIPRIAELLKDYEIVYGCRNGRLYEVGVCPFIANKLFLYLVNVQFNSDSVRLSDIFTGQRGYRRYVLEQIDIATEGFELETELTLKAINKGFSFVEIDIPYVPRGRKDGKKIGITDFYKILRFFFASKSKTNYLSLPKGGTH